MSQENTAVAEKTIPVVKSPKEPLFSKKNRRLLTDPLTDNNPITVQVLGVCSALAVTTQLKPSIVMTLSVIFVVAFSNLITSLLRKGIPSRVRMIVQLIIIATLVTVVDQVLKAFVYDLSVQLSVYIGLIITNCIVMGRLEAFAMANTPWKSFLDGVGNAAGYGAILIIVSFFRELFGSGKLLGYKVIPQFMYDFGYVDNGVMLTPVAAMCVIAVLIWVQRTRNAKLVDIS